MPIGLPSPLPTAIIHCPDCGVECNFIANSPAEMPFSYPGTYKPHEKGSRGCLERQIRNLKKRIGELTEEKFVILLKYADRLAVVIDNSPEGAIKQARLYEPDGGWEYATTSIVTRISASRTAQVLAMDRMNKVLEA